jgi:hypothetical protein
MAMAREARKFGVVRNLSAAKQVLVSIHDEAVRAFWTHEYNALGYEKSANGVSSIANKLGAFLAHLWYVAQSANPKNHCASAHSWMRAGY